MRGKIAKKIRAGVLQKLYGGDVPKDQVKLIKKTPKFKEICRAAKKRYNYDTQEPVFTESKRQQRLKKASVA
jgi:translation elongation factor EF-4